MNEWFLFYLRLIDYNVNIWIECSTPKYVEISYESRRRAIVIAKIVHVHFCLYINVG